MKHRVFLIAIALCAAVMTLHAAIKLDKEQTILRNFWLVKFNGELPIVIYDTGYKLDGPLTLETFRDKKISALHNNEALGRDQEDTKSETKETTVNKESSQK